MKTLRSLGFLNIKVLVQNMNLVSLSPHSAEFRQGYFNLYAVLMSILILCSPKRRLPFRSHLLALFNHFRNLIGYVSNNGIVYHILRNLMKVFAEAKKEQKIVVMAVM